MFILSHNNIQMDEKKKSPDKKMITPDSFYDSFGIALFGSDKKYRELLKNEKLYNLFTMPERESGFAMPKIITEGEGYEIQADTLFLPTDNGYRYLLVVVDCGNRAVDAEPMKTKTAEETLKSFKAIFRRRYVHKPLFTAQVDAGTEFKSVVKQYFEDENIFLRVAQVGRTRQEALVEAVNKLLSRAINFRMVAQELMTNETAREWVQFVPAIVKALNAHLILKKPRKLTGEVLPCKGSNCVLLDVGDAVRVKLDKPKNVMGEKEIGSFRVGDIRWENLIRHVEHVMLTPDEPPLYVITGKKNVMYTRQQLQPVPKDEKNPPTTLQKKFIVEKLLKKRTVKNKADILVKWEGIANPTWEPRKIMAEDVPQMLAEFEKKKR
jgi:hypothetical protein